MTDKVQKIREEVERLKRWNNNVRNSTRHMTLQEEDFNRGKHSSYLEILNFIDSLREEPVSDDLEEAVENYAPDFSNSITSKAAVDAVRDAFKAGAKWQKSHLWKPADGDDLPIIDREVIVLVKYSIQRNIHDKEYFTYRVEFGHRPNPNGWDAKSIITEKVEHYTPETYGKGGWNIPDVKWWLDCSLPNLEED